MGSEVLLVLLGIYDICQESVKASCETRLLTSRPETRSMTTSSCLHRLCDSCNMKTGGCVCFGVGEVF